MLRGIIKIIDELGLMILAKDIEIEELRKEIDELKDMVSLVDEYMNS